MTETAETGSRSIKVRAEKEKELLDPLLCYKIALNEDIYAITWCCLRKDVWEGKTFRGQKITFTEKNISQMWWRFWFFMLLMSITLIILFWEVFFHSEYIKGDIPITILRIALVGWAQNMLSAEFTQSFCKFRYAFKYPEEFSNPYFAYFVSLVQFALANITLLSITIFVSIEDTALDLIMDFTGLGVLSDLDDWMGSNIVVNNPHDEDEKHPNEDYDISNINDKLDAHDKVSLIKEHFFIVDDQNYEFNPSCFMRWLSFIFFDSPWFLFPLVTLPISRIMYNLLPQKID